MSKHSSFRVGGLARDFFVPNNTTDLSNFLKKNNKNIFILGLGSNILVDDKGFDGVVISTKNLNKINIENKIINVECGVTLAKLSRFGIKNNQNGINFLGQIPGSVGGALKMNAGCFGREVWDFVQNIQTMNKFGKIYNRDKKDFKTSYREVRAKYKDEFFLSAKLKFDNNGLSKDILAKRFNSQPIGIASCGSVFKNPPGDFAARLIEESNLKGFCIGGACVSEKHSNFIINQNNASAMDIKSLITYIQQTVKSKFDISLEPEVKII